MVDKVRPVRYLVSLKLKISISKVFGNHQATDCPDLDRNHQWQSWPDSVPCVRELIIVIEAQFKFNYNVNVYVPVNVIERDCNSLPVREI
jgi:hypothetical protein